MRTIALFAISHLRIILKKETIKILSSGFAWLLIRNYRLDGIVKDPKFRRRSKKEQVERGFKTRSEKLHIFGKIMKTHTEITQKNLTPETALHLLKDGNKRFVSNLKMNRNLLEQVNQTAAGQFPFAVVLSCIDSRVSAELVFDQGLGDIFSIRIAGNILNDDILGSMEFSCKLAGSKLIVVVGHSECGAVKGACDNAQLGHLTGLLEQIRPAVVEIEKKGLPRAEFVQETAALHVHNVVTEVFAKSDVLREMIQNGDVGLVGAMYSVQSGETQFDKLICGKEALNNL